MWDDDLSDVYNAFAGTFNDFQGNMLWAWNLMRSKPLEIKYL
jgi:hypothetical protein